MFQCYAERTFRTFDEVTISAGGVFKHQLSQNAHRHLFTTWNKDKFAPHQHKQSSTQYSVGSSAATSVELYGTTAKPMKLVLVLPAL